MAHLPHAPHGLDEPSLLLLVRLVFVACVLLDYFLDLRPIRGNVQDAQHVDHDLFRLWEKRESDARTQGVTKQRTCASDRAWVADG